MSLNGSWRNAVTTVRPAPALGRHVVDHLRRLIITGQLAAGTHLVESQLSETFDVSRGPVRDALRQLEAEGLVESRRRGVFVIGLTVDDIEELYVLRHLLEAEAVRQCMRRGGDLLELDAIVLTMGEAAREGDAAAFAEADLEFHSAFYALAGHRRLEKVWQQYRPTFADMLSVTNAEDRDLAPIHRDHLDLLARVRAGDQPGALSLLREHIDGSRERMLTAYARFIADPSA
ncbi:GntR family transcriptional regulator [Georgenia thermotolerans]|uniref:GntR family transcriptional regulator n=1 Tax=Georgenia thermotolerans TaxID=527326 RepID=UPI001D02836A|nr:GntR family transcriptional regulator [Georgenia thermotolerans]